MLTAIQQLREMAAEAKMKFCKEKALLLTKAQELQEVLTECGLYFNPMVLILSNDEGKTLHLRVARNGAILLVANHGTLAAHTYSMEEVPNALAYVVTLGLDVLADHYVQMLKAQLSHFTPETYNWGSPNGGATIEDIERSIDWGNLTRSTRS